MTEGLTPRLAALGTALGAATRGDLAARRRRRTRRLGIGALVALVLGPAAVVGASQLIGGDDVARSLPAGTRMLIGTDPVCTAVEAGVRFRCELRRPPADPEVADLHGTVEPTVDARRRVNGGCRSLDSDGRHWDCFVGEAAVREKIIGAGFLGEYAPSPGVG